MNDDELQKMILLEQSGELSETRMHDLKEALSLNPDASAYRDALVLVADKARDSLDTDGPSPEVITAIKEAGEARVAQRRTLFFPRVAIHAFAYAAVLAIMIGGWFLFANDGRSERILEIRGLMAAVNVEELSQEDPVSGQEDDRELRALARQLLIMEGLYFDDDTSAEFSDESLTIDAAPSPTVLRGRNTDARRARRYV
jgi:hypothetical protein